MIGHNHKITHDCDGDQLWTCRGVKWIFVSHGGVFYWFSRYSKGHPGEGQPTAPCIPDPVRARMVECALLGIKPLYS